MAGDRTGRQGRDTTQHNNSDYHYNNPNVGRISQPSPIIPNEGTNIPYLWCSYIFVFTLNLVKQDLWNQRGVWVFERTIFLVGFHEEMLHVGRMRVKVTDL